MKSVASSENCLNDIDLVEPKRAATSHQFVLTLVALAMIAALIAHISFQQALQSQAKSDQMMQIEVVKPQLYYLAYAAQIALSIAAALAAMFSTDFRTIDRSFTLRLPLLLGATVLMTLRGYSLSDLLSTKLVDWTGPLPFVLSLLVFIGAQRRNWIFLNRLMVVMAVILSALVLLGMAGLQSFSREEGVVRLMGTLNDLYWPASWIVLTRSSPGSPWRFLRLGPISIYTLGSLFTQTRLNFVMIFALIAVFGYMQRKRRLPQAGGWVAAALFVIWFSLFTAMFLKNSQIFARLDNVVDAFSSRLDEDTRTGQLVSFAHDVKPQELILGRGSFATWFWGGDYAGGTDVGYLTLLFYGGMPLLLTYVATHIAPCFGVLRKKTETWQLTAAGVVFLWGIRMFSSDYPAGNIGYYFVLFCLGACISKDPFGQARPCRLAA